MTEDKIKESITLRGICEALQAMHMPSFDNLKEILEKFGYTIIKKLS